MSPVLKAKAKTELSEEMQQVLECILAGTPYPPELQAKRDAEKRQLLGDPDAWKRGRTDEQIFADIRAMGEKRRLEKLRRGETGR